ncbi:MAG: acyl-CoA thioester hydrolase [Saprospiraceae bacterium]|jgi:acyl-CoA thioester hydrolase
MIETYRGTIFPWECDFFEHVNVRHYVAKFDEATWQFMAHFGMTPTYFKSTQTGIFNVEHDIRYKRELFSGDLITVKTEMLEVGQKFIKYRHVLIKTELQEVAAEMYVRAAHVELKTRHSVTFPKIIYNKFLDSL